ncbi:hypothetical protein GCT13_40445 [Paraburkholderia sp. CNPSo 3157]|uniref:Uncharacterized protein n=1 Tax=Paraburkholderia franconis TaxID=2654983 RepID=A0A7X1NJ30_9BURK|nr:hypothetical protein [Paraburkholderia franconis]
MTMGIFIVMTIRRNFLSHAVRAACKVRYRIRFLELVANRIAPDTHRVQACRDVTHVCPGGCCCRPRETLVPGKVQKVSLGSVPLRHH